MARYIECDCCGKRTPFGNIVYQFDGRAGLYCSAECFVDTYGATHILDYDLADDCYCSVFDDEARRKEIEDTIEVHRKEIECLQRTLELLTAQN
jgi:hypothetical protein